MGERTCNDTERKSLSYEMAFVCIAAGADSDDFRHDLRREGSVSSLAQLNAQGMTVGVSQSSAAELTVREELPDARPAYFADNQSGYLAVAQGKADAFVYDYNQMRIAIENGVIGVHLLDETLGEPVRIAVGISPVSKIPELEDKMNQFIGQLRADGTLDDMFQRWVINGDDAMPEIPAPESPAFTLAVGTSGIVPPYSYYVNAELAGYDIELAHRFAACLGADLEFKVYDYGAFIPATVTGDVDCIMADLSITPERAEVLPFSDVLFEEKLGVMVAGEGDSSTASEVRWRAYNGKTLGILTGTNMEAATLENFPDSDYLYLNGYPDCNAALLAGKIDGYLGDEPGLKSIHAEQPQIDYIHEYLTYNEYNFAFRKNDPDSDALREELNAWLAESWENGTMDEIDAIWFGADEDRKLVDMSDLTGENGTIRVVTTSTDMPFSYIKDGVNVGYDIDVVVRFCRDRGYALELIDVDFAARIPALQSGKADFTTSMNVTPEREEEVNFSNLVSSGGMVLAVRAEDLENTEATAAQDAYTTLSQLDGKRIGIPSGTSFDLIVEQVFPDAELSYYNNQTDLLTALSANKIDAFPSDEPVIRYIMNQRDDVTYIPEYLDEFEFAYGFPKTEAGQALRDEFSAFLKDMKANGALDALTDKWFSADETAKTLPDIQTLPATNGTLTMATDGDYMPFEYVRGREVVGYDVDIAAQFCEAYGYGLKIEVMNLDAILPAVQSWKCDFGGSALTITPERAENVLFSEPNYSGGTVMAVLKGEALTDAVVVEEDSSFIGGIKSSFHKTFIREDRWKLFTQGVLTTLLITLLTILFGTLLGFGLFMLCRNGNPVANLVTRFCLWLVQGMPMVVLLMILYYIVFGSVAINGVAVAVIGFTLTFGAAVYGLLKMGVGAVDDGQYEAACALGYSNRRTFFKIILPQALPHVLPAYRGEIVGLIKATAIVGYIAVQDLTKMGDIVRSRTYEAFFLLIAVTVIYFVLEGLIGFLVSRISLSFNPKRRKPADILKGVKTDDQN